MYRDCIEKYILNVMIWAFLNSKIKNTLKRRFKNKSKAHGLEDVKMNKQNGKSISKGRWIRNYMKINPISPEWADCENKKAFGPLIEIKNKIGG